MVDAERELSTGTQGGNVVPDPGGRIDLHDQDSGNIVRTVLFQSFLQLRRVDAFFPGSRQYFRFQSRNFGSFSQPSANRPDSRTRILSPRFKVLHKAASQAP